MTTTYNSVWNESVGAYGAMAGSTAPRRVATLHRVCRSPLRTVSTPMALEQRIMFDAALMATAAEVQLDAFNDGADWVHPNELSAVSETKAVASKGFRAQLNAYGLARKAAGAIEVGRHS